MSKDCSSVPREIITNHLRCMKCFPCTRHYGTLCLSHCIWQSLWHHFNEWPITADKEMKVLQGEEHWLESPNSCPSGKLIPSTYIVVFIEGPQVKSHRGKPGGQGRCKSQGGLWDSASSFNDERKIYKVKDQRIPKMEAGGWHVNIVSRRKGPSRVTGGKPQREMSIRFRRKIFEEEKG